MPNNIGAFGENFPYSNQHDLNMDWIINTVKDFLDKYSTIEQKITDGTTQIENATETGIETITAKVDELKGLLDQWYATHSEDIANELASALDDIVAQLNIAITSFNQRAEQKALETIQTIPADYTTLANEVENIKANNSFNVTPQRTGTYSNNGITYEWQTNGACHVSGTSTSASRDNIFDQTSALPTGWRAGEKYYVDYPDNTTTRFQVLAYDGTGHTAIYASPQDDHTFTIPANTVGMWVRLWIANGMTVNETVKPIVLTSLTNKQLTGNSVDILPEVRQLEANVTSLKQHELTLNLSSTTNLNRTDYWEQGTISPVTGEDVVSSERIRTTNYLPTNVADVKLENKTRGYFICGYDENETFLGVYNSSEGWTIDNGTGYDEFNMSVIYQRYPLVRLRLYIYSRNGVPVTIAEAQNITMTNIYNQLIEPHTIRVMQYNIGRFNYGHDGGYSGTDLGLKLSNMRKLMTDYKPDILCLQEYRQYVNSDNTANADYIIFNDVLPYKSYEENGYVTFMHYQPNAFRHTYLHTEGDYPSRMVYGTIISNNMQVAIGTSALNALGSSTDASMKKRALNRMIEILEPYDVAIIGIDANPQSEEEANNIKEHMKQNGYRVANWDYSGYLDTYNPYSTDYKKIDNIFIKGNARFLHVETVPNSMYNSLMSDHIPLIADVLIYK